MSKLKYLSTLFFMFSVAVGATNLYASELSSEVTSETIGSEQVSEAASEVSSSELVSEQVKSETVNEQVESESVSDQEDSEIVTEEKESEATIELQENQSETVKNPELAVKNEKSSVYNGYVDNRVNGTGSRIKYEKGVKTEEYVYSNWRLTARYWYYSNGNPRQCRTYVYNSKTSQYDMKKKQIYNEQGRTINYQTWSESGKLYSDYDYVSNGNKLTRKTFFYEDGAVKEIFKYNASVATDRKGYYPTGEVNYDYNYGSTGIRTTHNVFRKDGTKEYYDRYDADGKVSKSTKYREDKSAYRYIEYYTNGKMKYRKYYYTNGNSKQIETWNSNGIRTKFETWTSKSVRTDYRTYYDSGQLKLDNNYYSNGKVSSQVEYYTNGRTKSSLEYYSNGKLNVKRTYNSAGKKTYYRSNYNNGKVYIEYPSFYSNGKPIYRYSYTYHSNGVVKTINRRDYTASGKYSEITETYNTSGRQTGEKVSSPNALSYFKSPMRGGYITCQYRCYDGHNGIDFGNTNKTVAIYSTAPGTVVQTTSGCSATGGYLGNNCNYGAGNYVVVKHNYGGKQYFSIYMHLSAINVKQGQSVTTSTKIGNMGLSGNTSGPHLHFELFEDTDKDGLRSDEYRTNPLIYLNLSSTEIKIW